MSVVFRTADSSELTPGNILLSAGYSHRSTFNLATQELDRIPALALVLRLPETDLRARAYPETFRSERGSQFVNMAGASVPLVMINARERRVAPAALDARPFHHILSEHRLLPFDAETGTMLIDRCPECSKSLAWTVIRSINRCPCGTDLRPTPPRAIDPALLDGCRMMANLLDPRPDIHETVVATLPDPLANLDRGHAFEIGWQLAIATAFPEQPSARSANWPDDVKLRCLDIASRLIAGWPGSAERAFAALPTVERRRETIAKLSALARSNRVPLDVRKGIMAILPERALPTRLASAGRPHGANLSAEDRHARRSAYSAGTQRTAIVGDTVRDSVSINQAAHIFGKTVSSTSRMMRALEPVDTLGSHKARIRYAREAVMALAVMIDNRLAADTLSHRSGIPLHGLEQMICLGHLDGFGHPAMRLGYEKLQIDRRSLARLVERLKKGSVDELPDDWPTLRDAMTGVGGREKPWGPALSMMLVDRTLPYFWSETGRTTPHAKEVHVSPTAYDLLRATSFDREEHGDFDFDDEMNARDAASTLNICPAKFCGVREELFGPYRGEERIPVEKVLEAAGAWVAPGEIAARTGKGATECYFAVIRRNVAPEKFGFPRNAVEDIIATLFS